MKSIPNTGLLTATASAAKGVASGSRAVKTGGKEFLAIFSQAAGGEQNRTAAKLFDARSAPAATVSLKKTVDARARATEHVAAESAPVAVKPNSKKPQATVAKSPERARTKPLWTETPGTRTPAAVAVVADVSSGGDVKKILEASPAHTLRDRIIRAAEPSRTTPLGSRAVKADARTPVNHGSPSPEKAGARKAAEIVIVPPKNVENSARQAETTATEIQPTRGARTVHGGTRTARAQTAAPLAQRGRNESARTSSGGSETETVQTTSPTDSRPVKGERVLAIPKVKTATPNNERAVSPRIPKVASETTALPKAARGFAAKAYDNSATAEHHSIGEKKPLSARATTSNSGSANTTATSDSMVHRPAVESRDQESFARVATRSDKTFSRAGTAPPRRVFTESALFTPTVRSSGESGNASASRFRETDRIVDRFWQTRLTTERSPGYRAEISPTANESGSRIAPSEIVARPDSAQSAGEKSIPIPDRAPRTTVLATPTMNGKSLWGVRIGSGQTAAKVNAADQPQTHDIPTQITGNDAAEIRASKNSDAPLRNDMTSRQSTGETRASAKHEVPRSIAPQTPVNRHSEGAPARVGGEWEFSAMKSPRAHENGDMKHAPARGEEATVKGTHAERIGPATGAQNAQNIMSASPRTAMAESGRIPPRPSAARVEQSLPAARSSDAHLPQASRSDAAISTPERASLTVKSRPAFQPDASDVAPKNTASRVTPASTGAARTTIEAAEISVRGTPSARVVEKETVTKRADFPATKRDETSVRARSAATSAATILPNAEKAKQYSAPIPRAAAPAIRLNRTLATDPTPATPREFFSGAALTKHPAMPNRSEKAESRTTPVSPNRGENEPVRQAEIVRRGENSAELAHGKSTAAGNARAPVPTPAPAARETSPETPQRTTKPATAVNARQTETFRSPTQEIMTDAVKTPPVEPRPAVKPLASASPANVPVFKDETQSTRSRPTASGQMIPSESRPAAATIPLSAAPHRPHLSAEQVRELQAMVARSVQNARTNISGESTTRFSMQHATLGALQFRVTTRRDDVTIEISSPHRETTETLEEGRPAVERAIADLGLRVERFDIRLRDASPLQDPMQRGLDADRQPTRDDAAGSPEETWAEGGIGSDDAEEHSERRPLLAEHEWVA